jgi:hypothetical protein
LVALLTGGLDCLFVFAACFCKLLNFPILKYFVIWRAS